MHVTCGGENVSKVVILPKYYLQWQKYQGVGKNVAKHYFSRKILIIRHYSREKLWLASEKKTKLDLRLTKERTLNFSLTHALKKYVWARTKMPRILHYFNIIDRQLATRQDLKYKVIQFSLSQMLFILKLTAAQVKDFK